MNYGRRGRAPEESHRATPHIRIAGPATESSSRRPVRPCKNSTAPRLVPQVRVKSFAMPAPRLPVATRKADSWQRVESNRRQKQICLSGKTFRLTSRSSPESMLISKELRQEILGDGLHYDGAVPGEQSSFGRAKRDGKMRRVLRSAAVVAVFAFISVSVAKADGSPELYYSLTGPGGATASFYLPINPVIAPENVDPRFGFQVTPIDLMVDGSGDPCGYVMFYDITQGGGLSIDQGDVFDPINPDGSYISLLDSGTGAAPDMLDV